jgi:hypothetical protein
MKLKNRRQLLEFLAIRNGSEFSSNMQFESDAIACGFHARDLGQAKKEIVCGGSEIWRWETPFGCLVEAGTKLALYPSWQDFLAKVEAV